MHNTQAIILAAGKAKRFKTNNSKLLETLCGQEMVLFITKALAELDIETTVIVGHQKEAVINSIKQYHGSDINFVTQETQEGTGHAVLCSRHTWTKDTVLILNGDMPLVTPAIIKSLYQKHEQSHAMITLAVAHNTDPNGSYGRIIVDDGKLAIVEAKEFTRDIEEHPFINAGIYLFDRAFLAATITSLARNAISNEFYITDLIQKASETNQTITPVTVSFDRVRGINNFQELWAAEQIIRSDIINHWMLEGVRFILPQTNHVDLGVTIGAGGVLYPGVQLFGNTNLGTNCTINSFSCITNSSIKDNVTIMAHSVLYNSHISSNSCVGPFAHICDDNSNTIHQKEHSSQSVKP